MIKIIHTPSKQGKNGIFNDHYTINGDAIDEIVTFCSIRVRPSSWNFYKEELNKDLSEKGNSLIDIHAGMGKLYTVNLIAKQI